jgi:branched-chain amino acid transport system substrate-binding protein
LNPESTSPALTDRGYKWFFRTTADDAIFARNFFEFLQDVDQQQGLGTKDLAIVYENTLWGTGVGQTEKAYASEFGFNVVADIPYASGAESVDAEVQTLLETGNPIVMQASYLGDAILYMETYQEMNFQPTALLAMDAGFINASFIEAVGSGGDNILSREVWARDLAEQKPLVQQVDDLYFEKYGDHMDGNSARAFTGLLVLADAINRAGSTDPEAIRQALLAADIPGEQLIMPWEGISFDPETGQNTQARGIIVQLKDGVYHTVWPWDMASEDLVWPMAADRAAE